MFAEELKVAVEAVKKLMISYKKTKILRFLNSRKILAILQLNMILLLKKSLLSVSKIVFLMI